MSRYGALTLGSGGRKRGEVLRRSPYGASDKELDLPRALHALRRSHEPAHEAEHGVGEQPRCR